MNTKLKFSIFGLFILVFSMLMLTMPGSAQVGIQDDIEGFVTEIQNLFLFIIVTLIFVDVLMWKIAGVSILKWIFSRVGA